MTEYQSKIRMDVYVGVGDWGRWGGGMYPPKVQEKYSSGNYYVKFGHFPAKIV